MTKEFANELDNILAGCIANGGRFESTDGRFSPITIGERLLADGYGRWISGNDFMIFPQGVDFYTNMGGYTAEFIKQDELEKLEKQNLILQNKELEYKAKIRHQESVIRIWQIVCVILGIISLATLFFKFKNPFL